MTARQKNSMLAIQMENSSAGIINTNNAAFVSSKEKDRKGFGLASIKAVANQYAGYTDFRYDGVTQVFRSVIVLTL